MSSATETYNICSVPSDQLTGAPIPLLLLRDLTLVSALLGGTLLLDSWLLSFELPWVTWLGALAALPLGLQANGLFHEWGHFTGARLYRAHTPTNQLTRIFPMFHFDAEQNSHRQFLAMSIGGTITEWLFPFGLLMLLDHDSPAQIGFLTGAFTAGISAIAVEGPIILDALKRGDGIAAWNAYLEVRDEKIRRTKAIGVIGSILIFTLLFFL